MNKGFALLEVLLSVTILTGGILFALGAQRSALRLEHTAEKRLRAVYLLDQKLAMVTSEPDLEPGVRQGTFEPPEDEFLWRAEVSTFEESELPGGSLLRVDVEVEWPSRPKPRVVSASRLLWIAESAE